MPGRDCEAIEQQIRALETHLAALQRILEEPDLSGGTIARLHQQIFETGQELVAARAALENCRSPFVVVGVERTQGIQFFSINDQGSGFGADNSVPLVVGRPLMLRVYVDSKGADQLGARPFSVRVTGRLVVDRVRIDGSLRRVATLRPVNGSITARSAGTLDRGHADHSLNFRLAAAECRGRLSFSVVVFEQGPVVLGQQLAPAQAPADDSVATGSTSPPVTGTLTFTATSALRIRLIRIAYRNAARGYDLPPPTAADFWAAAAFVQRTFPVPRVEVLRDSVELYDGDFSSFFASAGPGARGTTGTIFEILTRLRSDEGLPDDVHFLALIPGAPANRSARGHAISGRQICEVDGPVLAQEIAHDSGFPQHAPCGGPNDEDTHYPRYRADLEASIGEYGYDVVTSAVFNPATHHDFMSYCSPKWISPYTYGKLLNHFRAAQATQVNPMSRPTEIEGAVVVAFSVSDRQIGNVHVSATAPVANSRTDLERLPLTVRTRDAVGAVLDTATVHVADRYQTAQDPEVHASAELPLRQDARIVSILEGGEVLWEAELPAPPGSPHSINVASAGASGNAETLTVTWAQGTAAVRDASVDYSADGGQTWQTVATEVTSEQLLLDASQLPGGEDCRVRVTVTNGCRVNRTVSDPFPVDPKPRSAVVISPRSGGRVFADGDTVRLLGDCVGPDRPGDPQGMNWTSSIDGFLGSGDELLVNTLSRGRHRITLAIDDGVGGESADYVFLRVEDDGS